MPPSINVNPAHVFAKLQTRISELELDKAIYATAVDDLSAENAALKEALAEYKAKELPEPVPEPPSAGKDDGPAVGGRPRQHTLPAEKQAGDTARKAPMIRKPG